MGLGDQERDPEEQVDVAEEATVEEVHDALVQEERGWPLPHVAGDAPTEEFLQTQRFVIQRQLSISETSTKMLAENLAIRSKWWKCSQLRFCNFVPRGKMKKES